jgi:hypothetical protein
MKLSEPAINISGSDKTPRPLSVTHLIATWTVAAETLLP